MQRLVAALVELDAFYREHQDRRPIPEVRRLLGKGHHLQETSEGTIDVLGVVTGERDHVDLLPHSEEFLLDDYVPARVLTLEMLIRLKEEMGRDKDRAEIPLLRATLDERRKLASEQEGLERGE